jgi:hypothetical protein
MPDVGPRQRNPRRAVAGSVQGVRRNGVTGWGVKKPSVETKRYPTRSCVLRSCVWISLSFNRRFLPEVREFITRHTAYNKHDTGWAKGAPSEDHTTPFLTPRVPLRPFLWWVTHSPIPLVGLSLSLSRRTELRRTGLPRRTDLRRTGLSHTDLRRHLSLPLSGSHSFGGSPSFAPVGRAPSGARSPTSARCLKRALSYRIQRALYARFSEPEARVLTPHPQTAARALEYIK